MAHVNLLNNALTQCSQANMFNGDHQDSGHTMNTLAILDASNVGGYNAAQRTSHAAFNFAFLVNRILTDAQNLGFYHSLTQATCHNNANFLQLLDIIFGIHAYPNVAIQPQNNNGYNTTAGARIGHAPAAGWITAINHTELRALVDLNRLVDTFLLTLAHARAMPPGGPVPVVGNPKVTALRATAVPGRAAGSAGNAAFHALTISPLFIADGALVMQSVDRSYMGSSMKPDNSIINLAAQKHIVRAVHSLTYIQWVSNSISDSFLNQEQLASETVKGRSPLPSGAVYNASNYIVFRIDEPFAEQFKLLREQNSSEYDIIGGAAVASHIVPHLKFEDNSYMAGGATNVANAAYQTALTAYNTAATAYPREHTAYQTALVTFERERLRYQQSVELKHQHEWHVEREAERIAAHGHPARADNGGQYNDAIANGAPTDGDSDNMYRAKFPDHSVYIVVGDIVRANFPERSQPVAPAPPPHLPPYPQKPPGNPAMGNTYTAQGVSFDLGVACACKNINFLHQLLDNVYRIPLTSDMLQSIALMRGSRGSIDVIYRRIGDIVHLVVDTYVQMKRQLITNTNNKIQVQILELPSILEVDTPTNNITAFELLYNTLNTDEMIIYQPSVEVEYMKAFVTAANSSNKPIMNDIGEALYPGVPSQLDAEATYNSCVVRLCDFNVPNNVAEMRYQQVMSAKLATPLHIKSLLTPLEAANLGDRRMTTMLGDPFNYSSDTADVLIERTDLFNCMILKLLPILLDKDTGEMKAKEELTSMQKLAWYILTAFRVFEMKIEGVLKSLSTLYKTRFGGHVQNILHVCRGQIHLIHSAQRHAYCALVFAMKCAMATLYHQSNLYRTYVEQTKALILVLSSQKLEKFEDESFTTAFNAFAGVARIQQLTMSVDDATIAGNIWVAADDIHFSEEQNAIIRILLSEWQFPLACVQAVSPQEEFDVALFDSWRYQVISKIIYLAENTVNLPFYDKFHRSAVELTCYVYLSLRRSRTTPKLEFTELWQGGASHYNIVRDYCKKWEIYSTVMQNEQQLQVCAPQLYGCGLYLVPQIGSEDETCCFKLNDMSKSSVQTFIPKNVFNNNLEFSDSWQYAIGKLITLIDATSWVQNPLFINACSILTSMINFDVAYEESLWYLHAVAGGNHQIAHTLTLMGHLRHRFMSQIIRLVDGQLDENPFLAIIPFHFNFGRSLAVAAAAGVANAQNMVAGFLYNTIIASKLPDIVKRLYPSTVALASAYNDRGSLGTIQDIILHAYGITHGALIALQALLFKQMQKSNADSVVTITEVPLLLDVHMTDTGAIRERLIAAGGASALSRVFETFTQYDFTKTIAYPIINTIMTTLKPRLEDDVCIQIETFMGLPTYLKQEYILPEVGTRDSCAVLHAFLTNIFKRFSKPAIKVLIDGTNTVPPAGAGLDQYASMPAGEKTEMLNRAFTTLETTNKKLAEQTDATNYTYALLQYLNYRPQQDTTSDNANSPWLVIIKNLPSATRDRRSEKKEGFRSVRKALYDMGPHAGVVNRLPADQRFGDHAANGFKILNKKTIKARLQSLDTTLTNVLSSYSSGRTGRTDTFNALAPFIEEMHGIASAIREGGKPDREHLAKMNEKLDGVLRKHKMGSNFQDAQDEIYGMLGDVSGEQITQVVEESMDQLGIELEEFLVIIDQYFKQRVSMDDNQRKRVYGSVMDAITSGAGTTQLVQVMRSAVQQETRQFPNVKEIEAILQAKQNPYSYTNLRNTILTKMERGLDRHGNYNISIASVTAIVGQLKERLKLGIDRLTLVKMIHEYLVAGQMQDDDVRDAQQLLENMLGKHSLNERVSHEQRLQGVSNLLKTTGQSKRKLKDISLRQEGALEQLLTTVADDHTSGNTVPQTEWNKLIDLGNNLRTLQKHLIDSQTFGMAKMLSHDAGAKFQYGAKKQE